MKYTYLQILKANGVSVELYELLFTLIMDSESQNEESLCRRAKGWADFSSGCDYYPMDSPEIKHGWIVSQESVQQALYRGLENKIFYYVTEETVKLYDQFFSLCGAEYCDSGLELGNISVTQTGICLYHSLREMWNLCSSDALTLESIVSTNKKLFTMGQKRKSWRSLLDWGEDEEYALAPHPEGVRKCIEDNNDYCQADGEIFPVRAYSGGCLSIVYNGYGCKIKRL